MFKNLDFVFWGKGEPMKRKIYTEIVRWKRDGAGKTALLIDGARRVGKSFIAEEFARAEYKSYILIDFNRVSDEVQLFPRARAAIKYLVADGRYDYMETGSLISIKKCKGYCDPV